MLNPVLDIGGAEKVLTDIILSLKTKYSFSVAARKGFYSSLLEKNNIPQFSLPIYNPSNIYSFFQVYNHVLQLIKSEKPDIVHTHHRALSFMVGLIPFKSFIHLHTMHCLFNDKKILTRLIKPDHTIAVGENVFSSIINNFHYPRHKCSVIRNGIRFGAYKKNYPPKFRKLVCIGRLDEIKGQKYLLQAAAILKGSHILLEFIGDGPQKKILEDETKRLSITEYVKFSGTCNNIEKVLLNADILISPSLSEGLPLVPLEALSCRVPVIATSVEGNREIIINHKTGITVPPKDAMAIAEAILWAIHHREEMIRYATTGYNFVKNRFSIRRMIHQYDKLYGLC